jgi:hypothetical protein
MRLPPPAGEACSLGKSRLTYETASPAGGGVFPGASRALA